jgi:hypothetical protein
MKLTLSLLVLGAFAPILASSYQDPLYFNGPMTVQVGDIFQETLLLPPISLQPGSDLYAFQTEIDFDPAVLELLQVTEGDILSQSGDQTQPFSILDNTGASVTFDDSLTGATMGYTPMMGGTLETITFQAIAVSPSTTVSLNSADTCLQNSSDVSNFSCTFSDDFSGYSASAQFAINPASISVAPEPAPFKYFCVGLICLGVFRFQKRYFKANEKL